MTLNALQLHCKEEESTHLATCNGCSLWRVCLSAARSQRAGGASPVSDSLIPAYNTDKVRRQQPTAPSASFTHWEPQTQARRKLFETSKTHTPLIGFLKTRFPKEMRPTWLCWLNMQIPAWPPSRTVLQCADDCGQAWQREKHISKSFRKAVKLCKCFHWGNTLGQDIQT